MKLSKITEETLPCNMALIRILHAVYDITLFTSTQPEFFVASSFGVDKTWRIPWPVKPLQTSYKFAKTGVWGMIPVTALTGSDHIGYHLPKWRGIIS